MKLAKKPGIIRRPLEYGLVILIILMVIFVVWANWYIKRENNRNDSAIKSTDMQDNLTGSVDEINELTEAEVKQEQEIDESFDAEEQAASSADSAADNIGGVYDESNY